MYSIVALLASDFLTTLLASGFLTTSIGVAEDKPLDAVRGAIARMEAIISGRITCHHLSGVKNDLDAHYYDLTFSGTSWKKRHIQDVRKVKNSSPLQKGMVEIIRVSHKGRTIDYQVCPQQDGTDSRIADVRKGEIKMLADDFPIFPQYAGTFWYARTLKYVKDHQSEAKYVRADQIDGVDVVVYDWPVSKANKFAAFQSMSPTLEEGGTLRVFIAPSLGYMIPRVEHIGTKGKLGLLFTASDFKEYNGFHIPQKALISCQPSTDRPFDINYKLTEISDINEPIPESEFVLTLPVGTHVADATSGTHSEFFSVSKDPDSIPEQLQDVIQSKWSFIQRWGWQGAVGLGVLLGLLILGIVYMVRWFRSRRVAV